MLITIKLQCSQSLIIIEAKLMELLLGIIIPTTENAACYSGQNVMKPGEGTI